MLLAIWGLLKDVWIGLAYIVVYVLIALAIQAMWSWDYMRAIKRGRNTDYLP
jgi:hypothetical protein